MRCSAPLVAPVEEPMLLDDHADVEGLTEVEPQAASAR